MALPVIAAGARAAGTVVARRGVRNAKATSRYVSDASPRAGEGSRTASSRFRRQTSIGARVLDRRFARRDQNEDSEPSQNALLSFSNAPRETGGRTPGIPTRSSAQHGMATRAMRFRKINWWMLTLVGTALFWIVILALMGLVLIGVGHYEFFGIISINDVGARIGSAFELIGFEGASELLQVSSIGLLLLVLAFVLLLSFIAFAYILRFLRPSAR